MGWEGRKKGEGGREGEGRGGERGEDVEGPGKWSAPGPVLALGGPGFIHPYQRVLGSDYYANFEISYHHIGRDWLRYRNIQVGMVQ